MTPDDLAAIRARAEAATYYGGDDQERAEDTLALLAEVERLTRGQDVAYLRGHEDGFWNGKTTDMNPKQAAEFMAPYRADDGLRAVMAERDALAARIEQLRSAIRLISPDHITPQGASILNAALADPKEDT